MYYHSLLGENSRTEARLTTITRIVSKRVAFCTETTQRLHATLENVVLSLFQAIALDYQVSCICCGVVNLGFIRKEYHNFITLQDKTEKKKHEL